MLLASHRHSADDLAHWHRLERADLLRGERLARGPMPARAIAEIQRFVAEGPCYVGTSWGKDSVVALHLTVLAGVRVPVVHIVQEGPQKDPDQAAVRDEFLRRWDVDYREIVVESLGREQDERKHAPELDAGIRAAQRLVGSSRWIGGLRAQESRVRKIRAKIGTPSSCWPLSWWTAEDVYAWLAVQRLPVHPAYACTMGGAFDRDWIRVSIIGGQKGRQHGREEWELRYYPEIVRGIERARRAGH